MIGQEDKKGLALFAGILHPTQGIIGENICLIDVREPHELEISHLEGAESMPLGLLAARMHELDSAQEIVLLCKAGTRSARALELLTGAGFRKIKNLRGGINSWAREIDPSLPVY